MKVSFNGINSFYKIYYNNNGESKSPTVSQFSNIPVFKSTDGISAKTLKPLTYFEKKKIDDMNALLSLMYDDKHKFSLDKASDLIKNKIDKQLMLYSENDIKNVVKTVMKNNPDVKREEVLSVLSDLSNFSNYNSLSKLEEVFEKNNIQSLERVEDVTLDNLLMYLSAKYKKLIKLPSDLPILRASKGIVADRNIIKNFKKKIVKYPEHFEMMKNGIQNGSIKIFVPDGWEAKTEKGFKSFNIFGGWGDLSEAVSLILKEKKAGKNPFTDDIISDLKDIFGEDVPIHIVKNPADKIDEKTIAERLNGKNISKKEIKDFLIGVSTFCTPSKDKPKKVMDFYSKLSSKLCMMNRVTEALLLDKCNKDKIKSAKDKFISDNSVWKDVDEKTKTKVQENLVKVLYSVLNVYSPRRIATELKVLNSKIEETAKNFGKTGKDALYILSEKEKSFGLITYQYLKANNISPEQVIYVYSHDTKIPSDVKSGKFFVFLDDFAGSGQSMISHPVYYKGFRIKNPAQPFIFAPLSYTKKAYNTIKKEIFSARCELRQRQIPDCLVGATEIEETDEYLNLLSASQKALLKYCFHSGYTKGTTATAFPHVVPDNCSDTAGLLLENILRNKRANKAKINEFKKDAIEYIIKRNNN